jgi:hypothetical protein
MKGDSGTSLVNASNGLEKGLVSRVESAEDGACGSSPSPRAAKSSLLEPFESIPGR